jgi:hypothetical protein
MGSALAPRDTTDAPIHYAELADEAVEATAAEQTVACSLKHPFLTNCRIST